MHRNGRGCESERRLMGVKGGRKNLAPREGVEVKWPGCSKTSKEKQCDVEPRAESFGRVRNRRTANV